jgi:Na+-translocating ferredoxin:NAD+ oxidoreductase RnfD subunit
MRVLRWFFSLPIIVQLAIRQILFLVVVIKLVFHYPVSLLLLAASIFFAYGLELVLLQLEGKKPRLQLSAVINTTCSVFLMILCSSWWVYLVSLGAGIAQKHLIKVRGMHIYNPSNIAVLVAVFIFRPYTSIMVSPLGSTPYWWLSLFFAFSAGMLVWKLRLWHTTAAFMVAFLLLQSLIFFSPQLNFFKYIFQDLTFQTFTPVHPLYILFSGNFVLFSFLFITDPKTIPHSIWGRILFGILVALGGHLLSYPFASIEKGLFVALFFIQLFIPYIRIFLTQNTILDSFRKPTLQYSASSITS